MSVLGESSATDLVQAPLYAGKSEPQRGVVSHLRSHRKSGSKARLELGALDLPSWGLPALPGPLAVGVPAWVGPAGFLEQTPPFFLHLANRVVYEHASWLRAEINAARSLLSKEGMCLCAHWVGAVGGRAPGARCQQETREAGTWRRNGVRPAVLRARGAQRQETNCSRFVLSFVCLPTPLPSPSGCPHRDHSGSSNSERFTTKRLPGYKRIPTHGHQQAEPELPTVATSRMVSGLVLAASRVVPGSVASPFPQPQLVRKNKLRLHPRPLPEWGYKSSKLEAPAPGNTSILRATCRELWLRLVEDVLGATGFAHRISFKPHQLFGVDRIIAFMLQRSKL